MVFFVLILYLCYSCLKYIDLGFHIPAVFLMHCYCYCSHNADKFWTSNQLFVLYIQKDPLRQSSNVACIVVVPECTFTVYLKFSKHLFYTCLGKGFFVMVEECNILINSDVNVVGKCVMFETINNFDFSVFLHL
jgi:hypothetical protein